MLLSPRDLSGEVNWHLLTWNLTSQVRHLRYANDSIAIHRPVIAFRRNSNMLGQTTVCRLKGKIELAACKSTKFPNVRGPCGGRLLLYGLYIVGPNDVSQTDLVRWTNNLWPNPAQLLAHGNALKLYPSPTQIHCSACLQALQKETSSLIQDLIHTLYRLTVQIGQEIWIGREPEIEV